MEYHFMSLGSNCAPILFLGPDRIKGPVDNVIILDAYILKFLIDGTYFDYVTNPNNYKLINPFYGKSRPKDPDKGFEYKYLRIIHNDPRTPEYAEELKKRLQTFQEFLRNVRTKDNYYFTFCMSEATVDTKTHKVTNKILYGVCEYLKSQGLLNKLIFVQTHAAKIAHGGGGNCYINDITKGKNKYKFKVVDLYGEKDEDWDKLHKQFMDKVVKEL